MDSGELERLVLGVLPGARVTAADLTGTRDHWEIRVVSPAFAGKPLVERHRMLHRIFEPLLAAGPLHAVKYKTLTPEEDNPT